MVRSIPPDLLPASATPDSEWLSPNECVEAAEKAGAPVVWLAGEPLFHAAIGEVAAVLADAGRYVFIETGGAGLRQRIHEFVPVERLYLTLRIPVSSESASASTASNENLVLHAAISDAIRMARLAGFHVCGCLALDDTATANGAAARLQWLAAQYVDGIVVVSAISSTGENESAPVFDDAVRLIPSAAWRQFSRQLELSQRQQSSHVTIQERETGSAAEASACEETA